MLLTPIVDASFPHIVKVMNDDREQAELLIQKIAKIMGLLAVCMALGTFLLADFLVIIFSGTNDNDAGNFLRVLSVLPIIIAATHILGPLWMVPLGEDKAYAEMFYYGVATNVILMVTVPLISPSLYFAALIILFSHFMIPFLMFFYLKNSGRLFFNFKLVE